MFDLCNTGDVLHFVLERARKRMWAIRTYIGDAIMFFEMFLTISQLQYHSAVLFFIRERT